MNLTRAQDEADNRRKKIYRIERELNSLRWNLPDGSYARAPRTDEQLSATEYTRMLALKAERERLKNTLST